MVRGRPLQIISLNADSSQADMGQCDLIYIALSEEARVPSLVDDLKGEAVLTVSEIPDFLDNGGMIRFFRSDNTLRFEINESAIREEGITLRSKLLRLASRVR